MWICPVCGKDNGEGLLCERCGFDESLHYKKYRTLAEVDAGREAVAVEEQKKRALAVSRTPFDVFLCCQETDEEEAHPAEEERISGSGECPDAEAASKQGAERAAAFRGEEPEKPEETEARNGGTGRPANEKPKKPKRTVVACLTVAACLAAVIFFSSQRVSRNEPETKADAAVQAETENIEGASEVHSREETETLPHAKAPDAAETEDQDNFLYTVLEDGTIEITGYQGEESGDLVIPNKINGASVTKIGESVFSGCSGFRGSLVLPEGLQEIGSFAFYGCSGFNGSLALPESLEKIGGSAFNGCSGFRGDLTLPESLTYVEGCAFKGCSGFNGNLKLPEGLEKIEDSAFYECSGFSGSLTLPEGLTYLGEHVFYGCSGFSGNLTLPEGLTYIGEYAFYGCSGFSGSLRLPEGLEQIKDATFYGCRGFNGSLTLPKDLKRVGDTAFYGCEGFKGKLTLPKGLEIQKDAFAGCDGLDIVQ